MKESNEDGIVTVNGIISVGPLRSLLIRIFNGSINDFVTCAAICWGHRHLFSNPSLFIDFIGKTLEEMPPEKKESRHVKW